MTDHPAKANEVNAERLAALIAFADDPNRRKPVGVAEVYDGPEIRPDDDWSSRDLKALADRRAGHNYYEGP